MNLTMWRRSVCALALCMACVGAYADAPAEAAAGTRLALSQAELILRVAQRFPCTAAAILQALGSEPAAEGTLLLDTIPTPEAIVRLMGTLPSVQNLRDTLLGLRDPYSDQAFFIRAQWVASLQPDSSFELTFRTQWVARDGSTLSPQHLVEPDATLRISEKEVRFTSVADGPLTVASLAGDAP